jgi:hypothetical protein
MRAHRTGSDILRRTIGMLVYNEDQPVAGDRGGLDGWMNLSELHQEKGERIYSDL